MIEVSQVMRCRSVSSWMRERRRGEEES